MTTICSVRFNGKTAIAGDGQVMMEYAAEKRLFVPIFSKICVEKA